MRPLLLHLEKVLLVAAGLTAMGVGLVWGARTRAELELIQRESKQVVFTGSGVAPTPVAAAAEHRAWTRPPAQTRGGGWVYELFTPPAIVYDPAIRSFAVRTPHESSPSGEEPFGWELLAVRRAPYRLQLAGYFGEPGDYLAAFVGDPLSPVWLARPGQRSDALGVTLQNFEVRRVVAGEAAAGGIDFAAVATLHDAKLGAEVILDDRSPRLTDTPLAVLQPADRNRPSVELAEGDTFTDDAIRYRIERIQRDPPEVVIARTSPDMPVPELRVLRANEREPGCEDPPAAAPRADPGTLRGIAHHP